MLTPKQEQFAQGIVSGMSQADAYRSAYNTSKNSDKTVWEKASRLMADDKVKARVQELRDKIATESIMTAQERLEWLSEVVKDGECTTSDKMRAIDIMNRMQGEYVQKVQAEVTNAISINIELSDD